jgi:hypothetical protein
MYLIIHQIKKSNSIIHSSLGHFQRKSAESQKRIEITDRIRHDKFFDLNLNLDFIKYHLHRRIKQRKRILKMENERQVS